VEREFDRHLVLVLAELDCNATHVRIVISRSGSLLAVSQRDRSNRIEVDAATANGLLDLGASYDAV
jgi:hypothetical protein